MSRSQTLRAAAMCLLLASVGRAEAPADPLRLVPEQADVMIKIERPRQLVETGTNLDLLKQLQTLDAVGELYSSTNYRRFRQLISYFETQLAGRWPDLLDRLAGGGIVLASKLGHNPAPALLVVQGKDEELLKKFVRTFRGIVEDELARDEAKDPLEVGRYRDLETLHAGKDLHLALAGSALLISNKKEALQLALDRHLDGGKQSLATVAGVVEARKLLPADAFGWLWLNLESARRQQGAKAVLDPDATDPNLTILLGGFLEQFRKAPFLAAALAPEGNDFLLTFRTPVGRDALNEAVAAVHVPPLEEAGALPLLEPRGVIFSTSYFLDLAQFWEKRTRLLNAELVKGLEDADATLGKVLAGNRLSKLLTEAGPHQRLVVAHQPNPGYRTRPGQKLPAFAFVIDMRAPKTFAPSLEGILRGAALTAGTQFKLRLIEQKHGDAAIIGYRFPEEDQPAGTPDDVRFNFSPAFVAVGKHFVISSTIELAHELVDVLDKEAKRAAGNARLTTRTRFYLSGGAEFLKAVEDQLLAQTILERALAPAEARDQVKKFVELVKNAGALQIEHGYTAKEFRFDFRYAPGKRQE